MSNDDPCELGCKGVLLKNFLNLIHVGWKTTNFEFQSSFKTIYNCKVLAKKISLRFFSNPKKENMFKHLSNCKALTKKF